MAKPQLPNPAAGQVEALWYAENLPLLGEFQDRWVAILGQEVVISGLTFDQVYEHLNHHHISNALIAKVPSDLSNLPTLIA